ncbi:zinc finger RAD18 domain containing protein [Echinococcus multilocularis]|uniref:Protein with SprT-like domain at the N terminus n=1 Tax=Echinococcus multilocularis TaxID=6211 RepID=A0A087VY97_ECHMU|nr:zinc finger RAD18 domain containing protein [Echinococcus multilocularis]
MSREHNRVDELNPVYHIYHPLNDQIPTKVPKRRYADKEGLSTPNMEISPVDPIWQSIDPTPDVRSLFATFDAQFFGERLSCVEVRWSPRMTLCAGQCIYEGPGGLCSIRLSEPLLKYRPRSDLVETLLHEMIHAYLFVTQNKRDRSAHGPVFRFHMNRINKCAKTNITVYHSFHDEVDNYKVHWWKCNGPCANRPPFYGLVRRSMNRAPGPNDLWWAEHQASCSGQFIKISEPESPKNTAKKSKKGREKSNSQVKTSGSTPDLRQFFQKSPKTEDTHATSSMPSETTMLKEPVVPFSGVGHRLGGSPSPSARPRLLALTAPPPTSLQPTFATASATGCGSDPSFAGPSVSSDSDFTPMGAVQCPVCFQAVLAELVNEHLDACLVAA